MLLFNNILQILQATSLVNVDKAETPSAGKKARQAASANSTPTNSLSSITGILSSAGKSKHKADLKKIKVSSTLIWKIFIYEVHVLFLSFV